MPAAAGGPGPAQKTHLPEGAHLEGGLQIPTYPDRAHLLLKMVQNSARALVSNLHEATAACSAHCRLRYC